MSEASGPKRESTSGVANPAKGQETNVETSDPGGRGGSGALATPEDSISGESDTRGEDSTAL